MGVSLPWRYPRSGGKDRAPNLWRRSIRHPQSSQSELSLPDPVHEFDSRDRNRRISKPFESQHRTQSKFDGSMILFNQIVQIFRRSQLRSIAPPMLAETLPGRTVRSLVAIKRDGARQFALALERSSEESFRCCDISLCAQQEIDGLSVAIDGAIQIGPPGRNGVP